MKSERVSSVRGQLMPAWLGAIILAITFTVFIASYGNMVATEIRAQSEADALASAAVATQSLQFNQMLETLYAADVEEYRLRFLLESIRLTANYSGGCRVNGLTCGQVWTNLLQGYRQAEYRYDQDAKVLSRITSTMNYAQTKNDINAVIGALQVACANPNGSAMANAVGCNAITKNYKFHVVDIVERTQSNSQSPLKDVYEDAMTIALPDYIDTGNSQAFMDIWAPVTVEVAVCATVPSVLSNATLGVLGKSTTIMVRGAATDAIIEQDWIQPGAASIPYLGLSTASEEFYGNKDASGQYNWYAVNFGGNPGQTTWKPDSPIGSTITSDVNQDELSVEVGWWGPLPVLPFSNPNAIKQLQQQYPECAGN